jgi:hypothetical protein
MHVLRVYVSVDPYPALLYVDFGKAELEII